MSAPESAPSSLRPVWALVAAVVIVVLLPRVPLISMVLRPLAWLGTLAHETGHGLGAAAMGGHIDSIQVFTDGSGVAHASGAAPGPVSSAVVAVSGLVGPAVASVGLLWTGLGPRLARVGLVLLGLSLVLAAATVTQGFATVVALGWGAVALVAGVALPGDVARLGVLVVSVLLALHVHRSSGYLFAAEAHTGAGTMPSDVVNVADALGGHYLMWGVGVGGLDVLLLAVGLLGFYLGDRVHGRIARRRSS